MKKCLFVTLFLLLLNTSPSYAGNIALEQAKEAGVKKCLPAIKSISDFIIENGNHGAHSFWSSQKPDDQLFTSTVERNFSDGKLLTSISVAPVKTGECAIVYEQVGFYPKSCVAVSKETFSKYQYKGELNKEVVILQSTSATVYLMPVEGGCVTMKKEIISDGNSLKVIP